MTRPVDRLTKEDFAESPVWRFTGSDTPGETHVEPVKRLPVRSLAACVVGVPIRLADGTVLTGMIGNFDPANPRLTEHFLTLSVFRPDGSLFHMARYHDYGAADRGSAGLAEFLGLPLVAVFPISYDLSGIVIGSPDLLRGTITAEPRERLTRAQIIALAVPKRREVA
jgi:hypothetical protein